MNHKEKTQNNENCLHALSTLFDVNIRSIIDYYIFTDGSGHKDGVGGWAAYILNTQTLSSNLIYGGQNKTTTYRQEFKALLEALQFLFQNDDNKNLQIEHYTDSESLNKGIRNEYSRRNRNIDLWNFYEFFEIYYFIESNHVNRDVSAIEKVDLHASSMREIIKQYTQSI